MSKCKAINRNTAFMIKKVHHFCGDPVNRERCFVFTQKYVVCIFILILVFILGGCSVFSVNRSSLRDLASVDPSIEFDNGFDINAVQAGQYEVGVEIDAGEYKLYTEELGYYEVSRDESTDATSVIHNEIFLTMTYITLEEGQYFSFRNAVAYPLDLAPKYEIQGYEISDGVYKVGLDIPAGVHKISSRDSDGYYEIKNDSFSRSESTETTKLSGEQDIVVLEGQYLMLYNTTVTFLP